MSDAMTEGKKLDALRAIQHELEKLNKTLDSIGHGMAHASATITAAIKEAAQRDERGAGR